MNLTFNPEKYLFRLHSFYVNVIYLRIAAITGALRCVRFDVKFFFIFISITTLIKKYVAGGGKINEKNSCIDYVCWYYTLAFSAEWKEKKTRVYSENMIIPVRIFFGVIYSIFVTVTSPSYLSTCDVSELAKLLWKFFHEYLFEFMNSIRRDVKTWESFPVGWHIGPGGVTVSKQSSRYKRLCWRRFFFLSYNKKL